MNFFFSYAAFNLVNISKEFASTDIYPFDTSMFNDVDYLGANVTNKPVPMRGLYSGNNIVRDDSRHATVAGLSHTSSCSSSVIQRSY